MAKVVYEVNEPHDLIALHTAAQMIGVETIGTWISEDGLSGVAVACANYLKGKNAWPLNAINDEGSDDGQIYCLLVASEKFEVAAKACRDEIGRRERIRERVRRNEE